MIAGFRKYRNSFVWLKPMKQTELSFCCCCLVSKLCPTLCNPMDCSPPVTSVLHYFLEFAQIHVLRVGNNTCLILCRPLLLLPSIFPSIRVIRLFPKSWLSASGDQSSGASALAIVLPSNIQGWFPLGLACSPENTWNLISDSSVSFPQLR